MIYEEIIFRISIGYNIYKAIVALFTSLQGDSTILVFGWVLKTGYGLKGQAMSDEKYKIIFEGKAKKGEDIADVKKRLLKLYKGSNSHPNLC